MKPSLRTDMRMPQASGPDGRRTALAIPTSYVRLEADLEIPENAPGVVLFVHGSGSSRLSPRNLYVAEAIRAAGMGTLLFDLLTREEQVEDAITRGLRYDLNILAQRLIDVTRWVNAQPATRGLKLGYFGATTGSAAAFMAAAVLGEKIAAIVCRNSRPDIVSNVLHQIRSPTLFIVGGNDDTGTRLSKGACEKLRCEKNIHVVSCATHRFTEPGKMEQLAQISASWFARHMGVTPDRDRPCEEARPPKLPSVQSVSA